MSALRGVFRNAGVLAATTVGAGVFSLPYVFAQAGWLVGVSYLVVLSALIVACHVFYFSVLAKLGGGHRLVGIVRAHLGATPYYISFGAVIVGLLVTLVVYLILGAVFLRIIFPGLDGASAAALFWFVGSLPLFMGERRMLGLEVVGILIMAALIALVFLSASNVGGFLEYPSVNPLSLLLPFGPVLFSLAGWTAIEPIFDLTKKEGGISRKALFFSILCGTMGSAALYALFIAGVLGSAAEIVPDTISGLQHWPRWEQVVLALFGLFAIWTSYVPVALEIVRSLERDCRWRKFQSMLVILCGPLVLVLAGLDNFLTAVGLAGGVFLSAQYLFIVLVARKVLVARGVARLALNLVAAVFFLAAVYEVYAVALQ